MRYLLFFLIGTVLIILLSGCLDRDFEEQPNIFSLNLTLPGSEEWYEIDEEYSIRIFNFKMVVDSIEVRKQGLENEKFVPEPRLVTFSAQSFTDEVSIGTGDISGGRFEGVEYTIVKPEMNTDLRDEHLIIRDEFDNVTATYSFAVTGTIINDESIESFTFRSDRIERLMYGFMEVIEMPETRGTLIVQLRGNWQNWFLDPDNNNEFLNPNDPSNRNQIEENILHHFEVMTMDIGGAVQ